MKIFLFVSCCFILATLKFVHGSNEYERARRQTSIGQQRVSTNKELFLLINGVRVVSLNGANAESRAILGSVTCNFGTRTFSIQNLGGGLPVTLSGIQMCHSFINGTLTTFSTSSNTFGSGAGQLYSDSENILYIEGGAQSLIRYAENLRRNAPRVIEPVTVLVVERADQLVLNIDNTDALNDNNAESLDDNLILTGSTCFNIGGQETFAYKNSKLTFFERNNPKEISDIEECYVLTVVDRCVEFTQNTESRDDILAGPGLLCTGINRMNMGQTICFYSEAATNENSGIMRRLVEGQMTFQQGNPTGLVVGALGANDGNTLFSVNGSTQTSSIPNAGRIEFSGGMVIVRDRFSNVLRQFGTSSSPHSLTYYTGTTLQMFGSSSTMNLNEAITGGLNIAVTDSMVFAYPSGNTFIQSGISMLQNFIPTVPSTPVSFSVQSSQFATINLFANRQLVQEVSDSMSVEIGRTQCVIYSNNMLNIFENCDTAMTVNRFSGITTFAYADSNTNTLRTFTGSSPNPFQGPGRLYIDGMRGFLTSRPELITLITNANNAGARAGVSIVAAPNAQGMTTATLVNGGTNLFQFDMLNTSITPIESNEGLIYSSGTFAVTDFIPVPQGATLQFTSGGSALIQGGPGPSMNVSIAGTVRFVQDFTGSTSYTTVSDFSSTFPGGGILYTGSNGAVYNRDSRTSSELSIAINSIEGLMDPVTQTNITVNSGGTIRMFTNSAGMLLRGPGTLYSNTGGRAFFTNDNTLINRIPNTVSRLVPFNVSYNSNTGDIVIGAGTMTVSSFSVDAERFRIPLGSMVTVNNGMITVTGGSGSSQVIAMDIGTITLFNGVSATNVMTMDLINLPVPGSFYIDEMQQEAIYVTEPVVDMLVANTINNAFQTFMVPIIPQPTVREVVTMEQTLNADFGQGVTINEGSTVTLRCRAGSANPPAMIVFAQRDRNSQNFTLLEGAATVRIMRGVNEATLEIPRVELNNTEYRCQATNLLGTATAFTRVTGIRGSPPEIQDNFFPGSSTPGTGVVAVRRMTPRTIRPLIDNSDVDDRSRITERVLIGCRAKGRGIPVIMWRTEPPSFLNFSSPGLNESRPGPGQSVLAVALEPDDVQCVTYICTANNSLGSDEGSATVCPERYQRRSDMVTTGDCEGTCGIGIRAVTASYDLIRAEGTVTVLFANLPEGLVKPDLQFCPLDACPLEVYEFDTTEFTMCTRMCGSGTERRTASCVRRVGNMTTPVPDQECIDRRVMMPPLTQNCNIFPCPAFSIGEFSECSRSCRGGVMTRNISCQMVEVFDDGSFSVNASEVDLEVCTNFTGQEIPPDQAQCNDNIQCPVQYSPAFGEECDAFNCQSVSFTCVASNENVPWVVDDVICRDQGLRPGDPVRSCGGGVCNFGIWQRTALGNCSTTCGSGVQIYNVVCTNRTNTNQTISDRYCNGNLRPASVESCFLMNCPGECVSEPRGCTFIAIFGQCKSTNLLPFISQCCKSCPAQATG